MTTIYRSFTMLIIAAFCLLGCSGPRGAEKAMGEFIEKSCHSNWPCVINLHSSTNFNWDKLYVFKDSASQAEIEQAIGIRLHDYRELRRYLIFSEKGVVVHVEDEPTNAEHPIKNELVFDMPNTVKYQVYPSDCSFTVSVAKSEGGKYYLLRKAAK